MKTASRVKIATLAVAASLVLGCIPSLHPFYRDEDVVFDASLVGRWVDESGETWEFRDTGDRAYELLYTDEDGKTGKFSIHMFKIGEATFLDLYPAEPEPEAPWNDLYRLHLMPVHTLLHVRQVRPSLQMAFPEPKWLEDRIAEDPATIRHEIIDDDLVVLTASTDELREFWSRHVRTDGAFGDYSDLKPATPGPAD